MGDIKGTSLLSCYPFQENVWLNQPAEGERQPTPENATLFQGFEWNVPADGKHWKRLTAALPSLKAIGISNIWLPPGCKASSPEGNG